MQYNKNSSSSVIGGAIYSEGTTTITNTSFMNNANTLESTTKGFGGAIYLLNNGDATISNCTFENNTTYQRGGAIYIGGSTSNTVITVSGSTFKNNIATNSTGHGGAICVSSTDGTVSLTSLTCSNNYVDNATQTSEDIAYYGSISSVTKNIGNISCENIYIDKDNTLNVIENINNTIKLTISEYVTGSQIINFNNFTADFTLADTSYYIDDSGCVQSN
jgi:predicted outer membrane repeat protein